MLNDRSLAERYPLMDKYTSPVRRAEREIVGREREMTRLMAAMSRPELCNAILLAEAGSGKALDDMTPIPTPYGMTRIKDLSPGDKVFDERGRVRTVLGVYPQGPKPAFRVRFEDGGSETCCEEHLWDVRTGSCADACAPYVTRRLGDVMAMLAHDEIYVPAAGPAEHAEADLSVPPYAAGVLLAAVMTHGDDGMDVWFSACGDEWVLRRTCDLLGFAGWSAQAAGRKFYFLNADGTMAVRPGEILARIGTGATSGGMAVETYLTGSVRQRTDFLRGLMDARGLLLDEDGALSVRFMSADEAFCGMVRRLAASLGIRTYEIPSGDADRHYVGFRPRGGTASARLDWFSGMFGSPNRTSRVAEVLARRHGACAGEARNYGDIRITGVEDLHEERSMTCIYVDSPRHLFLVGTGYHVTHNTALVQGTMLRDRDRDYLEVDLAKMVTACTTDANEMAALLKGLFDEVSEYCKSAGREAVLFIDEFHQIVQLSDAAVEALKPLLADSGTRGIRVIAATTYIEFRKYVAPNQPLVERLQRINLPEPGHDVVIAILKGMAERYDVAREIRNPGLYELIYEYTNRYIPANAQPRKSILVMDAMIGWHRAMNRRFDDKLLADVIYDSEGVNVNFNVDASRIKAELDKRVLSQKFATTMIEQRLQICAADLNNKTRPMSSFLFSGSSGTGKTEVTKSLANLLFGSDDAMIRMDMTEFANSDSLERFRRELTNRVWARPFSIILLDEMEKACSEVTRLLLQVLDDGRLMDENNRVVVFTNAYIVMTTNAGSEVYKNIAQYNADDEGSGKDIMKYYKVIRESIASTTGDNKFPPELLGRIDVIVPFQPLSEATMKDIATMNLKKLIRKIKDRHGVSVEVHQDVVRYLVEDNLDTDADSGGARVVISKMESEVTIPIARYINEHPGVRRILVGIQGKLVRDDKSVRVSDAHVKVWAPEQDGPGGRQGQQLPQRTGR